MRCSSRQQMLMHFPPSLGEVLLEEGEGGGGVRGKSLACLSKSFSCSVKNTHAFPRREAERELEDDNVLGKNYRGNGDRRRRHRASLADVPRKISRKSCSSSGGCKA
jgi:hypothetical protein